MKIAAVLPVIPSADARARLWLEHEIAGKLGLDHVLARLARVAGIGGILVATTRDPSGDPVEHFCKAREVACFRGDDTGAEDRLGLVLAAARSVGTGAVLLVRDDAPFIDPAIVQRLVDLVLLTDGMVDFVGTTLARSYPRGMDAEACTVAALEDADRRCADPALRRDAAAYLRQNSRLYRLLAVEAESEHARPDLGFALASEADLEATRRMFDHCGGRDDLSLAEMIAFAEGRI